MTRQRQRLVSALCIVALLLATAAGSVPARAQCATVLVTNQSPCGVNLCLYDLITLNVTCMTFGANTANVPWTLPASFVIGGVLTPAGNMYPFGPQPPTPACTPCITMTNVDTCCARVCFNKLTCKIGILPCAHPCNL